MPAEHQHSHSSQFLVSLAGLHQVQHASCVPDSAHQVAGSNHIVIGKVLLLCSLSMLIPWALLVQATVGAADLSQPHVGSCLPLFRVWNMEAGMGVPIVLHSSSVQGTRGSLQPCMVPTDAPPVLITL